MHLKTTTEFDTNAYVVIYSPPLYALSCKTKTFYSGTYCSGAILKQYQLRELRHFEKEQENALTTT
jgi:hypothetical protein